MPTETHTKYLISVNIYKLMYTNKTLINSITKNHLVMLLRGTVNMLIAFSVPIYYLFIRIICIAPLYYLNL